jgi:hypothetical protein
MILVFSRYTLGYESNDPFPDPMIQSFPYTPLGYGSNDPTLTKDQCYRVGSFFKQAASVPLYNFF